MISGESDENNPFEQVEVYEPGEQTYLVKVIGKKVTEAHPDSGGQPYALVVSGNFDKSASLYPRGTESPVISANPDQVVIIGEKNRWVLKGKHLQGDSAETKVKLTCADEDIPGVKIKGTGTATTVTVEITETGWSCPSGGVVYGILTTASGWSSDKTQVGTGKEEGEVEAGEE